jgi:hypothetical protein
VLYIVAAIVIPEAPFGAGAASDAAATVDSGGASTAESAGPVPAGAARASGPTGFTRPARVRRRRNGNGAMVFGLILMGLGGWFLLRRFIPAFDMSLVGPAVLIVVGVLLVVGALGRSGRSDG